jgi:hypothetical protein
MQTSSIAVHFGPSARLPCRRYNDFVRRQMQRDEQKPKFTFSKITERGIA